MSPLNISFVISVLVEGYFVDKVKVWQISQNARIINYYENFI